MTSNKSTMNAPGMTNDSPFKAILLRIDAFLWWSSILLASILPFVAIGLSIDAHRKNVEDYASDLIPVTGELLSTEVKFVPYRLGSKYRLTLSGWQEVEGYWCAFGMFKLDSADKNLSVPKQAIGTLSVLRSSRVKGTSPSEPWHSREEAEADTRLYHIGTRYAGWVHPNDSSKMMLRHPIHSAVSHVNGYFLGAGVAAGYFVIRTAFGMVVLRRRQAKLWRQ